MDTQSSAIERLLEDERVLFAIAVFLPPLLLLASLDSFWRPRVGEYVTFCLVSFVLAAALVLLWRKRFRKLSELPVRARWHMRQALVGGSGLGWPALILVLAVGIAFFAWFADGIKEHRLCLAAGALFYATSVVLAADLLVDRIRREKESLREILVSPVSFPKLSVEFSETSEEEQRRTLTKEERVEFLERYANADMVHQALKDNVLINADGSIRIPNPNFLPTIAVLAHPEFSSIGTLDLILASDTKNASDSEMGKFYWDLFKTMVKAVKSKDFPINNKPLDAPSWDVPKLRKRLLERYDEKLRERSEAFVFNITTGTAAMSAAIMLVALRGYSEGVYLEQIRNKPEDKSLVDLVHWFNMSIFDLPDVLNESVY